MTAPTHGKDGKVVLSAATVANVSAWKITIGKETAEVTSLSDQWIKRITGLGDVSGSITCYWDPTDTNGQVAMNTAVINGTEATLKLYTDATHHYDGKGLLKLSTTVNVSNVNSAEFSFVGTDSWAFTTGA